MREMKLLQLPALRVTEREPPLTDPLAVADTFATGCMVPEFDGGRVRITFYADRTEPVAERVVVARLVCTVDDFFASFDKVAAAIGRGH